MWCVCVVVVQPLGSEHKAPVTVVAVIAAAIVDIARKGGTVR